MRCEVCWIQAKDGFSVCGVWKQSPVSRKRLEVKDLAKGSSLPVLPEVKDKPSDRDNKSSSDDNSDEDSTTSHASRRQSHSTHQDSKKFVAVWTSSQESKWKTISSYGSQTLRKPHQHMAGVMIRRLDGFHGS